MTNQHERNYHLANLRETIVQRSRITVIGITSAKSGLSGTYMVFYGSQNITHSVASVLDLPMSRDGRAVRVRGAEESRTYELARDLSFKLFGSPHELKDKLH